MIQRYTWEVSLPQGRETDDVCDAVVGPLGDLMRLNRWVTNAAIELYEDKVHVILTMSGHDRWWIRKRAPYLIASVAARSRVGIENVKHVDVDTPPTLRRARFLTEDGKRVMDPPDGSEVEIVFRGCKACRDPKHWLWCEGWKTGPEAAHPGRGH